MKKSFIAKQQALVIQRKALLIFGAGAILLLFVGFLLGRVMTDNRVVTQVTQPTPTTSATTPSPAEIPISPPPSGIFKVTRVIDGDTIEIEPSTGSGQAGGERVRYIGIDTPETVDPRKPVQCFGVEASKKNKELVEGKTVRLEKDITDRDKYGRLLRYVWVNNLFVNLELVKQGFATSYSYPPDIKHQTEFLAAEREAREAGRGLWGACPAVSPTTSLLNPPAEKSKGDCNIKGNISTSGEKIYHLPGCGSYAKTQIDEGRGERWFCNEEEAQALGWRKALNCP